MTDLPDITSTPSPVAPRMNRRRRAVIAAGGATAVAGAIMVMSAVSGPSAGAVPTDVTLCHATGSTTNPYVEITVSVSAVENKIFGPNGHGSHLGPIFDPGAGKGQPAWGDIIPSFEYTNNQGQVVTYGGLNATAAGLAILNAGCQIPGSPSSSASSSAASSAASSSTVVITTTPPPVTKTISNPGITKTIVQTAPAVTEVVGGQGAGGQAAGGQQQGPIPAAVNAGLHTKDSYAGLKAWGILLMLLGGAAGLVFGLRPASRRAH